MIQELRTKAADTKAADNSEPATQESQRIQQFGGFFTGYMKTASVVTASLPISTTALHFMPVFASQEKFLNAYTSMSCFLAFAYVFYIRHTLARWMFVKRGEHFSVRFWVSVLPVFFICSSIGCAVAYHHELGASLDALATAGVRLPSSTLLSKIDAREIPGSGRLIVTYLGMFVFAESAFVLMALREHLQNALKLEERDLIFGVSAKKLGVRHAL